MQDEKNASPAPVVGLDTETTKGAFQLAEFVMNKKHLEKARTDIKKVKSIVVEMQTFVQDHQVQIKQNLVSEEKLKVNFELLEA